MFSQTSITQVFPPTTYGNSVLIRWQSSAPAGSIYQVYVNGNLSYIGQLLQASVPAVEGTMLIDVGTVLPSEANTNFSSLLGWLDNRAKLKWVGGTFESPNLAGFHVYSSPLANNPVNYSVILADISAYGGGIQTDGYGMGGFGGGGFGYADASYSWTSGTLTTGVWTFGVKPYDTAGNEGSTVEVSAFWGLPPIESPTFSDLTRLHYRLLYTYGEGYGNGTFGGGLYPGVQAVLTWLPTTG